MCLPKVVAVCSTLQGVKFKRVKQSLVKAAQGDIEGDVAHFPIALLPLDL